MRIEISAGRGAPPSGDVVVNGGPVRHFDGWLGLLGLLADALDPGRQFGVADGGGEVAAGGDADLGENV